jgi:C-terminal processing protease CtpA/Prc
VRKDSIARGILWTLSVALLTLAPVVSPAQQKMNGADVSLVRGILSDALDAVKKNYYDPKFRGIDLDARFHQYDDRIKNAANVGAGFLTIQAFLNGFNDTHLFFEPPQRANEQDNGFEMQMIGNTAYIVRTRPGTDAVSKVHPGDLVVHYNSYSVNRADYEALRMTYSSLMPQPMSILDLTDPDGKSRQVTVIPKVQQGHKVMDLTKETDLFKYERGRLNQFHLLRERYIESGDVMIWKMPEFDLGDSEMDHMFDLVNKHKTLILDLRSNPGGYTEVLERMVGYVFDHDVKISDRVGRKEMKPQLGKSFGSRAFAGKIIVLMDSDSASSSELFARVIQLEKRGIVIGDQSSGSVMEAQFFQYNQGVDTEVVYGFSVTRADLIMKDGKSIEHVGVTPDELVLPTAQDLAAGRDPVLARAAELAGYKLDPVAAGKMFPFEWAPM